MAKPPIFSLKAHTHSITFAQHRHDSVTTGSANTGSGASTVTLSYVYYDKGLPGHLPGDPAHTHNVTVSNHIHASCVTAGEDNTDTVASTVSAFGSAEHGSALPGRLPGVKAVHVHTPTVVGHAHGGVTKDSGNTSYATETATVSADVGS
jgi:hypothetical protein